MSENNFGNPMNVNSGTFRLASASLASSGNDLTINANNSSIVLKPNGENSKIEVTPTQFRVRNSDNTGYTLDINQSTGASSFGGQVNATKLALSSTEDATGPGTGALQVPGGLYIAKKLFVGENITVQGNLTVTGDTETSHAGLLNLTNNDDHTQYALLAGRSSGQTFTGSTSSSGNLVLRSTTNATKGSVVLDETTASTSNSTGALRLAGGIATTNTTDAVSATNGGTFTTAGGAAIAKKLFVGTDLNVGGNVTITGTVNIPHSGLTGLTSGDDHTQYTLLSGRSGGQIVTGGSASGNSLVLRSTTDTTKGAVLIDETTASTSNSTGALRVAGGIGISNTTDATSATDGGTFTTAGGAAIAKKLFIGTDLNVTGTSALGVVTTGTITGTTGRLDSLGIGTAPSTPLHILNAAPTLRLQHTTGTSPVNAGTIELVQNNLTGTRLRYDGAADHFEIRCQGTGVPGNFPFAIRNIVGFEGFVGIGTTTPAFPLDVIGGIRSSDGVSSTTGTFSGAVSTGALTPTSMSTTGTLGVTGTSTLGVVNSGNTSITGTLGVSGTSTLASFSATSGSMSGSINMNSNKITNLDAPTTGSDAANKSYVDLAVQGLSTKEAVRVATTGPGTLATSFENGDTVDGITLVTNDRILIKDQSNAIENGIYIVNASGAPTRAADFASGSSEAGSFVFVTSGTVNGDYGFVVVTDPPNDIVGTNELTFTQFSGAGQITAGTGLTKAGNTLSVNASQTQVTSVGTLTGLTVSGGSTLSTVSSANTTASTSNSTGAITLAGGIGISNTTDATSATNGGTFTTGGGAAIAKKLFVGTDLNVSGASTMAGMSATSGSFTGNVNMNSNVITNLGVPTAASDAATKGYVDLLVQGGLSVLEAVRVATTGPGTLASSFENGDVIDGITLVTDDRILIKDQVDPIENGIYIVNASGAPTRAYGFLLGDEVSGIFLFVLQGTVNADKGFIVVSDPPNDIVGTHSIVFTQFSGAGQIIAGTGITKTGETLSVNASLTHVTQVGTLTGLTSSGIVNVTDTTASTSNSTGALTLAGGIATTNTTDATSATNGGSFTTAGGIAVAKKAFVGTDLSVGGAVSASTLTTTDSILTKTNQIVNGFNAMDLVDTDITNKTLIIAHRFSKLTQPIYSLHNIVNQIKLGVRHVEMDISRTTDGVFFLSHGGTTTEEYETVDVPSPVTQASLKTAMVKKGIPLLNRGESLPTLKETWEVLKQYDVCIWLEDKKGDFMDLYTEMQALGMTKERVVFQDFDINAVEYFKDNGYRVSFTGTAVEYDNLTTTQKNKIDYIGTNISEASGVDAFNKPFITYTHNDVSTFITLKDLYSNLVGCYSDTVLPQIHSSMSNPYQTSLLNPLNYRVCHTGTTGNTIYDPTSSLTWNHGNPRFSLKLGPGLQIDNVFTFYNYKLPEQFYFKYEYPANNNTAFTQWIGFLVRFEKDYLERDIAGSRVSSINIFHRLNGFIELGQLNNGTVTTLPSPPLRQIVGKGPQYASFRRVIVDTTATFYFKSGPTPQDVADPTVSPSRTFSSSSSYYLEDMYLSFHNRATASNTVNGYIEYSETPYVIENMNVGVINSTDTTASTSNSTGALTLAGGVGISNTTDATSTTNGGTITTAGGAAIAKQLFVGGRITTSDWVFVQNTSWTTNGNDVFVSANNSSVSLRPIVSSSNNAFEIDTTSLRYRNSSATTFFSISPSTQVMDLTTTTASTSNSTGAFTLAGGIGISNTTDSTSITNGGTITTDGGASIGKRLFIGNNIHIGEYPIDGDRMAYIVNRSSASNATVQLRFGNNNFGSEAFLRLTSTTNTSESTAQCLTIRNDAGDIMIQTNGSGGDSIILGSNGNTRFSRNIDSTSSTDASVRFAGGISIEKTTDATSTTNGGTFTTAGGIAVAKKAFVGTDLSVGGATSLNTLTASGLITGTNGLSISGSIADAPTGNGVHAGITSASHACIQLNGGTVSTFGSHIDFGYSGHDFRGRILYTNSDDRMTFYTAGSNRGSISWGGTWNITRNLASTDNTTGALQLAGGIAISNATDAVSATNGGTFTTAGGAAIAKKLFVGTDASITGNMGVTGTSTLAAVNATNITASGTLGVTGTSTLATTNATNITASGTLGVTGTSTLGVVNSGNTSITGTLGVSGASTLASFSATSGSLSGDINMNSNKITNLGTPAAASDAATKSYVDLAVQGLSAKEAVRVATTAPGTLATSFENGDTIDGVTIATNDRILIKDQSNAIENGIYTVNASGAPTRAADFTNGSNEGGSFVFVTSGTTNGDNGFVVVNDTGSDVVGTNGLTFTQFSGAGQITAGTGLSKSGNTLSVNTSQTQITSVGTLTDLTVSGGSTLSTITSANTTASTSNTTGALTLAGGIGISNTTDTVSITNGGSFTTAGGASIAKSLRVGTTLFVENGSWTSNGNDVFINGNTASISLRPTVGSSTNSVVISTTQTLLKNASSVDAFILDKATDSITIIGALISSNTTTSTSNSTGALTLAGGIGISNTTDATSNTNGGTFTTAGGAAIAKKLYVGDHIFTSGFLHVKNSIIASSNNDLFLSANSSIVYIRSTINSFNNSLELDSTSFRYKNSSGTTVVSISTSGVLNTSSGIASTSNTTGSIITNGGIGISNTTDATSNTNGGTFTTAGGAAIAKKLFVGDRTEVSSTLRVTGSSVPSSGSGLELSSGGSTSNIYAYNRTGNAYLDLNVNDAMYIKTGFVGVGTTDPVTNLHTPNDLLFGSGGTGKYLGGNMYWNGSAWTRPTTGDGGFVFRVGDDDPFNFDGDCLQIWTSGPSDTAASRVQIGASGIVNTINTTASTSNSTGALTLAGGIGISNTTDATSTTNGGTLTTAGGAAIAKKLFVGDVVQTTGVRMPFAGSIGLHSGWTHSTILRTDYNSDISGDATYIHTPGSSSGSQAGFIMGMNGFGVQISPTVASTSSTTGALRLAGGIGISDTTDATSSTNGGTFTTAGGIAVAKKGYFGNTVYIGGTPNTGTDGSYRLLRLTPLSGSSTQITFDRSNTTGSNQNYIFSNDTAFEFSAPSYIFTGNGSTTIGGPLISSNTTASTSNTTGALQLAGGIGISNTTDATSNTNGGTFTTAGGAAIAKKLFVGETITSSGLITGTNGMYISGSLGNAPSGDGVHIGITPGSFACIQLNGGTASTFGSHIDFGYSGNDYGGRIQYTNSTNAMSFSTSGISRGSISSTGIVSFNNTTASTSNTTGALTLAGGIGISNTTDASSLTNGGTFTTAGGAAIAKKLFVGEQMFVGDGNPVDGDRFSWIINRSSGTNASAQLRFGNNNTGQDTFFKFNSTNNSGDGGPQAFTIRNNPGSIRLQTNGAGGATIILGNDGNTRFSRNIASTSSTDASVRFAGGISIENATNASSSTNGGTITTAGGAAIAKDLYVGTNAVIGESNPINGERSISIRNTNAGSSAFSMLRLQNDTGNDGVIFVNSSTRSADGGVGSMTIRNDGGALRLQSSGANGIHIAGSTGTVSLGNLIGFNTLNVSYTGDNTLSGSPFYNFGARVHNTTASGSSNRSNLLLFTDNNATQAAIGGYRANFSANYLSGILFLVGSQPGGYTQAAPADNTQASNSLTEAARITPAGVLVINGTTASTSNTTGIIQSAGGIGISDATDATSSTNGGTFTTAGGAAIAKNLYVGGALSKGSGTFDIPHPNPEKEQQGYRLRHSFVESPNRGDNIYRYRINTEDLDYTCIQMPEYFHYLNEDVQVFVTPQAHFGTGYGIYNKEKNHTRIHVNTPGEYNVLIIGTRKDQVAKNGWDEKGLVYKQEK